MAKGIRRAALGAVHNPLIDRSKGVAAVAAREAEQRLSDSFSQRRHLEQLAHLGRADELLRAGGEPGTAP